MNLVLITNAVRKRLIKNYHSAYPVEVSISAYNYRQGDLGMIDKKVMNYFKNFNKNVSKYGMKTFSPDGFLIGQFPLEKTIPTLLYKGNLESNWGYYLGEKRDYFIVPLAKDEFTKLRSTTLKDVKKEIKNLYKEMKLSSNSLNKAIEEQYGHLKVFDNLDLKIHNIPIETTVIEISQETVSNKKNLIEKLQKLDRWRAESMLQSRNIFIS